MFIKAQHAHSINELNTSKGIAIALIVLFHIIGQLLGGDPKWLRMICYQGVHMFVLASGLGLTYSLIHKKNIEQLQMKFTFWRNWYIKRALRIIPLYWLVLLMSMGIYYIDSLMHWQLVKVIPNVNFPLLDLLLHGTFLHIYDPSTFYSINVAYWFLGAIVLFYLVYPFIYLISRVSLFFTFALLLGTITLIYNHFTIVNFQITLALVFFIAGIVMAFIYKIIYERSVQTICMVFMLLVFLSFYYLYGLTIGHQVKGDYIWFSLAVTSAIYFFSMIITYTDNGFVFFFFVQPFSWFGKYSYAIFLIHWGLITPVIEKIDNFTIGLLVFIVLILFLGVFFSKIEKWLIKRLISKIGLY